MMQFKRIVFFTAIAAAIALCFWSFTPPPVFSPNQNQKAAVTSTPPGVHAPIPINGNAVANPYQYILEVLASIPSGTSLDQAQFDSVLGVDAGNFLRSLNVIHVDSLNGSIKVQLSTPYSNTLNGNEIRLGKLVQFSFTVNAAGVLICDPIAGIDVKANVLLGWMPVKHVEVSHDTAGNTIIEVEVSTLFGTVKRVVRLDPDGKPIP
ncbi:MAG: hypothetical protein JSS86_03780 [Cyanobacteria bacterium SZAS LIN-2]|nr:hypothetical protein [Cyanobacteria bacterium SZAS LIN-2]